MNKYLLLNLLISFGVTNLCSAQSILLPPSGDNQKCSITQFIGLVEIKITYNSPDVTGPEGENRKGKIWGGVVPYGMSNNNFGTAKKIPWRAGANENTTISFSHDVIVEGNEIAAGIYGIHMIPGEEKFTIIFSENSTSWGSYFYNEVDDILRIDVKPQENAFTEWLTYDFIEKRPAYTIAALKWEELMIPFKIEANVIDLYLDQIRNELQSSPGFNWQNWIAAVNFCISNNVNLSEALLWSDYAINAPFVGQKNFITLSTKANLLYSLGDEQAADRLIREAINEPTATITNIHEYGCRLIKEGKASSAMTVFDLNRIKFPDDKFITFIGLARGNEALGKTKQAIKNYRMAVDNAPDGQKEYYIEIIRELEKR